MAGVAVRGDWVEQEDDEDAETEATRHARRDRWTASDKQLPSNDVFLVEGTQLRYGSKEAWDAARRR